MPMTLVGRASTNSRANRPLPPGAIWAETKSVNGVREVVEFVYPDGGRETKTLLSWVGGQAGLLWGGPSAESLPPEIYGAACARLIGSHSTHGSYGHRAEQALADALGRALDGVFSLPDISCRFGLNGRDALDAAARVARAVTGRKYIATEGSYHGAGESFIHPPYPQGIPEVYKEAVLHFKWGDVETMREWAKTSAAICIDAPALPDEEVRSFLLEIRRACNEFGAVFILDEVVTGFRLGLQGAAGYYGVKPDIATYGKAMSATGGVSAIVGRRDMVDMLDGRAFFSLTFGGMPGPCAVAAETVNWLDRNQAHVYGKAGHLKTIGRALQDGLNAMGINTVGQPERSVMKFETDSAWLSFCSRMIERGVMVHRPQFSTLAHTRADVETTLAAARESLR